MEHEKQPYIAGAARQGGNTSDNGSSVLAQAGVRAEPAFELADGLSKFVELAIAEHFTGKEHKALRSDLRELVKSFNPKFWQVAAPTTPAQVPAAEVRAQALEEAAKLIDTKVYNYQDECGSYDHTTGVTEYPGNGAEWICEMEELAEEIRALASKEAAPAEVPSQQGGEQ